MGLCGEKTLLYYNIKNPGIICADFFWHNFKYFKLFEII